MVWVKLVRLTKKQYEVLKARTKGANSKPKSTSRNEPLAKAQTKEEDTGRAIVRICSYRTRLLDIDNLYGGSKYICDALRYAGIIRDDTCKDIDLKVYQIKVKTKKEERTEIEVIKDDEALSSKSSK